MSSRGETESLEITGLPLGTTEALEELARDHGQTAEEYARMVLEARIWLRSPSERFLRRRGKAFKKAG